LATYVRKYTNMRFEPAGITDDPELRIATSLVDYIFRRLAVDYLALEERAELGVLSTAERMQPTLPGVEETATTSSGIVEVDPIDPVIATVIDGSAADTGVGVAGMDAVEGTLFDTDEPTGQVAPVAKIDATAPSEQLLARAEPRDAPYCYQCGNAMQRAGSCYVCGSCGTTSGCS
jgi:ribonucleoside-diphosphate reductase alpha chain